MGRIAMGPTQSSQFILAWEQQLGMTGSRSAFTVLPKDT